MTQPSLYELEDEVRYLKQAYAAHKPSGLSDGTQSRNIMGALLLHLAELGVDRASPAAGTSITSMAKRQHPDGSAMSRNSSFASTAQLRSGAPGGLRSPPQRGIAPNQQRGNSPTASEASLRRHTATVSRAGNSRSSPMDPLLASPSSSLAADYFQPKTPVPAVVSDSVEDEANSTIGALDALDEYLVQWRDETDRRKHRSLLLSTSRAGGGGGGASSPNGQRAAAAGESHVTATAPVAAGPKGRRQRASFVGV
jgi:hypothetical protein